MSEIKIGSLVFGEWRVTKKIGHGAFSDVFCIEKKIGDSVKQEALKVIHISANRKNPNFRKQIEEEAAIMNLFQNHPNIVWFSDFHYLQDTQSTEENSSDASGDVKEPNDMYLIKMELLSPLSKHDNHLSIDDILEIGINICNALQACEQKNIIHRDIKPQNIFFNPVNGSDKQYELGDFGAAVSSDRPIKGTAGTIPYMAPEVYNKKFYYHSADIYSLGLVLYQYLNNNCLPFMDIQAKKITKENKELLEQAISLRFSGRKIPSIQGIDQELNRILQLALAFDPNDRYQSAEDFKNDLSAYKQKIIRSRKEEEKQSQLNDDIFVTQAANPGGGTDWNPDIGNSRYTDTSGTGWNSENGNQRYTNNNGNTWNSENGNQRYTNNGGTTWNAGSSNQQYSTGGSQRYANNNGTIWNAQNGNHRYTDNTGNSRNQQKGSTRHTYETETGKKGRIVLILGIIAALAVIAVVVAYLLLPNSGKFTVDSCNGMNVFSQEFADYEEELKDHGYDVKIIADTTGNPSDAGNIEDYDTSPNEDSSKNDVVTYYYSTAPDVVGQTADIAKQMLETSEWNCTVLESSDCSSNPVDDGCVYGQELDEEDPSTVILYVYKAK